MKIELTDAGNAIVAKAPQVAQGVLITGLEVLPLKKLQDIYAGLEEMVHILEVQEIPPRWIFSPGINLSKMKAIKTTLHAPAQTET